MEKRRLNNYDLLRVLCAIAVILIHVSGYYLNNSTDLFKSGNLKNDFIWLESIYNCIGRFAVPIFLMLTGTFLLSNLENKNFKYFYLKSVKTIVIPTIIFTVLYTAYRVYLYIALDEGNLNTIIKELIKGKAYYHLWYMYMIIGVYLLIPFIMRLQDELGQKIFKTVSIIFLPIAIISLWITKYEFNWNLGMAFLYSSYAMIGYVISKNVKNKSIKKFIIYLSLGIFLEMIAAYFVVSKIKQNMSFNYTIQGPSSPILMLASVFIFTAFSNLEIKKDFSKLSNLTFYIYLIHAIVWDVIQRINFIRNCDSRIAVPILTMLVFGISSILAIVYKKILNLLKKRKIE